MNADPIRPAAREPIPTPLDRYVPAATFLAAVFALMMIFFGR